MSRLSVAHTDSAQLLPATALAICTASNCRAVLIKGESATLHGTRSQRVSADIDVLVDPSTFMTGLERFEAAGWSILGGRRVLKIHNTVGATVIHPLWPQSIDLHLRFPGFTRSPESVFESLWADRVALTSAGQSVVAAGAATTCLIQALHALRNPQSDFQNELGQAIEWLRTADHALQERVVALASSTGALATAAPLFAGAEIDVGSSSVDLHTPLGRDFQRRAARDSNPLFARFFQLRTQPVTAWPGLIGRYLVKPDPMPAEQAPGARPNFLRVVISRIWEGMRQLPRTVRVWWRTR